MVGRPRPETTTMKLSDSASMILLAAANHPQHLARLPEKLPRAAANAVFRSLIKQDFLIEMTAPRDLVGLGWRQDEDGSWIVAKITDDGMRAIGLDPNEGDADPATAAAAPDTAPHAAPADQPPQDDAPRSKPPRARRRTPCRATTWPRRTRRKMTAPATSGSGFRRPATRGWRRSGCWTRPWQIRRRGAAGSARQRRPCLMPGMPARRRMRRTTRSPARSKPCAPPWWGKPARTPRAPGAPRKPREGTKQEQVLAMLRRPEGATVAQIAEATGWAQHTVRGFFAGLKKKGHAVEVIERVRQVGPNKEGARGILHGLSHRRLRRARRPAPPRLRFWPAGQH